MTGEEDADMARSLMVLTFTAAVALVQSGCTTAPPAPPGELLFDAHTGCGQRNHFILIDDPFGGPEQAGKGTAGAKGLQKMVLLNGEGFFAMPADPEGQAVVIRLAVKGKRDLRVLLVAGDQHASYRPTLPAEGTWCDIELPLARARRIHAGRKIVDITIWQQDTSDAAVLYVQKGWLASWSEAQKRRTAEP